MGKLKPIGSEKLQGVDKIRRMIEISNYNLSIPSPVNENTSTEYKKTLVDGNTYHIVKEKNGYVIKKGLNEDTSNYIEPIANRKYYSSYSQAFKRLNLVVKEINDKYGNEKNVSLFGESEKSDESKYYLTLDEQGTTPPAPQPAPAPVAPQPTTTEPPMPTEPVMAEPEMDMEMDVETTEPEDKDEEVVTYKSIQKSVGKLAQKTREFLSDENNQLDTKQIKYIVNSILSALPLDNLEEEDKEEIVTKFEGGEEMGMEGDDMEMGDEETMGSEEMGIEPSMETPTEPNAEMMEMIENIFAESKVDKVLKKYFQSESPKRVVNEGKEKKLQKNIQRNLSGIEMLSESFAQESSSKKLVNKYPSAKLLGRNKKQALVFEINNERIFVTERGSIV